ncbi:TetR/AcrR family transcriptional regulator [Nocardia alni]|uniref:TetR/AcrR family transcriptional regulator n=1 Tax=Nocardia alni TaxID=2815723 RepID=UPI001C24E84B|nr:TetR/AcrR family transcriptional regulator [Nocardia alni]
MTPQGLRERKKQATRAALSQAAWAMMLEQGLKAVSPESVAEIVGVSGRTFRNYFFSVEEAIVEAAVRHVESVADAVRARPADEPVWDALAAVLPDMVATMVSSREDVATLSRAGRENPAILAAHLTTIDRIARQLTEAIAERMGTDPEQDMSTRLLAAAAGVTMRTSLEVWSAGDGSTSLSDVVRAALAQLRSGVPQGGIAETG